MYSNHNKDVWHLLKRGKLALNTVYDLNDISTIPVLIQNNYQYTGTTHSKKTYIYVAACVQTCDKNGIVSECAPKTKGIQGRKR